MGKITIGPIIQRRRFEGPNREKNIIEVSYTTSKGYNGLVKIDKEKATEEEIIKAVRADAQLSESLIGMEISE